MNIDVISEVVMKKKIAILESGFMKYYLKDFLFLCESNGIIVDLFCLNCTKSFSPCVKKIFFLTTKYNPKNIKSIYELEKEIKSVVNINDYDYFLSDCIKLSFGCNILHNLSLAGKLYAAENPLMRFLVLLTHQNRLRMQTKHFEKCPKIFAASNVVKNDYIKHCKISPDKIVVVYPGTNNSNEQVIEKETTKNFVIGSVTCGFITKGGFNVLRALRVLLKKRKDIILKMINPKYKKQIILKLYLKVFGLEKYVTFLPFQENINDFYKEIDCLICASKYEAFGRIVTEAMTRKVPVVVGSNIGASEILEDGSNAFIFNAYENASENLANKIEEVMLIDKDKLHLLKNNAVQVATSYTWENFAKEIFNELYLKKVSYK